ncbi:MAG: SulP family inorganic anion transporter [Sedimenticola sp.]|uniref:SulP family inorganic anion transporter n=1 Tax=Sedimenticola thiotaurini TaxID=1543721 RepID=A0A558D0K4_9GAMM|nr:SulP family inorganic anion transporter [Sedimenticola sp.]TVT54530.1 MAG: SulP family inorganic anion transporter [Sedimenticola thiotaurini]MCW8946162.1 SulP family inorganic anion transporter [Sedimenticola sp.]MCW8948713.1 SulP family inorganic anion transporter [Sedimenticola sp.]MCW8975017.1 SulP family inorganic anion transporter [Sedimenticola sp.]
MSIVNGLHFRNLQGDIYGGLTAAVVALPLALAMGVSSGAGPIAGVYGAICVGFFAALFGGTPSQVSGPTGPMTVVMAMIFTQYTAMFPDNPAQGAALAFTVVMLGGLFQIGLGLLRVGKFIELVPHPVISGFMSGIGIIIILLQIGPLLGLDSPARPLLAMQAIPDFISRLQPDATTLGLITLVIVYAVPTLLPKFNKLIPAPLLALLVGTLTLLLLLPDSNAPILGDIPTGIPTIQFPAFDLHLLPGMIKSALTLAALGAIDSLLTSLVADNITHTHHKSDRELVGQGIGNTIAGLFGGLPGAGATMRTVVNIKAGGKTPISGALHALILLAIILGAGSIASHIPKAVLAGILIKVGTDIIDWDYFKRIRHVPISGIIKMLVVLLLTVFVDLITAVATGMVMASLLFMKEMVDLQLQNINTITDPDRTETPLSADEKAIMKAAKGDILLYHLAGPMSFGAAKEMSRRLAQFDHYRALVLDLSDVPRVDYTSSRAIDDMIYDAQSTGRQVFLVGGRPQVYHMLEKQGVLDRLENGHRHNDRLNALRHAANNINSNNQST